MGIEAYADTMHGEMVCVTCADRLTDAQRDDLTPIYGWQSEDLRDETDTPHSCGTCNGYIVEDERTPEYPLSRDILNLTVACGSQWLVWALSTAAHIAREHYRDGRALARHMAPVVWALWGGGYHDAAIMTATHTRDWIATWQGREIVKLWRDTGGGGMRNWYVDADGGEWAETDTRGYLDTCDDPCDGCGGRLGSVYYSSDFDSRCPECVEIQ